MARLSWCLCLGVLAMLPLGCGDDGTCKVTGTVTWNGQPLPNGDIIFNDVEGVKGPDAAKIKGGRFTAQVKPGKKRVEIRASREVPEKRTPMGPYYEDYIPPRYNKETELTADVTPDRPNQLEYKLEGNDARPSAGR